MTMEVYCKHQKPHQDALSSTTPVENRRTVGVLMGFLEVLAGVTKIEVAQFWRYWDQDGFIEYCHPYNLVKLGIVHTGL